MLCSDEGEDDEESVEWNGTVRERPSQPRQSSRESTAMVSPGSRESATRSVYKVRLLHSAPSSQSHSCGNAWPRVLVLSTVLLL